MKEIYEENILFRDKTKCIFVSNTFEALSLLENTEFDLIISNQEQNPKRNKHKKKFLSGVQFYNYLREDHQIYTDFILLTSYPLDLLIERPRKNINFHYVQRTANIEIINKKIYSLLGYK